MESEAEQVVPLLPLVLEQEYGPRAWGWFNDNAKDFLGGYEYDMEAQRVTLKEEDINAEVDQHWEQSTGDEYNGEISDEESENAYFIDIGHIILDATDRGRILDDESVETMKSTAEALRKTPQGWEDDKATPSKDTVMKETDTEGTTSTLTSTTKELSVEDMTPKQLEDLVHKASVRLKETTEKSKAAKTSAEKPLITKTASIMGSGAE
jgi:hypothetical protein